MHGMGNRGAVSGLFQAAVTWAMQSPLWLHEPSSLPHPSAFSIPIPATPRLAAVHVVPKPTPASKCWPYSSPPAYPADAFLWLPEMRFKGLRETRFILLPALAPFFNFPGTRLLPCITNT